MDAKYTAVIGDTRSLGKKLSDGGFADGPVLEEIFRVMNYNTFQHYYQAMDKKNLFNRSPVLGMPGKFVYRFNHNGNQGARKVHFGRVLLQAAQKQGVTAGVRALAKQILEDKRLRAKFYLGLYLSRSGRVDENGGAKAGDVSGRSGKVYNAYLEDLGLAPKTSETSVYYALFADWEGKDCGKSDNAELCRLMNDIFLTTHYIDFRRLNGNPNVLKKDPGMPVKYVRKYINSKKSDQDLTKTMTYDMAFPAFRATGYTTHGSVVDKATIKVGKGPKATIGVSKKMYKSATSGNFAELKKTGWNFLKNI